MRPAAALPPSSPFEAGAVGPDASARHAGTSAPARPRRSDRTSAQRQEAILRAAGDNFGRFGYRGASLRDIARDAGVSLTLLNHHFGDKSQLLSAVIAAQRPVLEAGVARLRALTADGAGGVRSSDVVQAWVDTVYAIAALPDGEIVLRVMARVIDEPRDPGVDGARDAIEGCTRALAEALQQCHPRAPAHAVVAATACATASLLKTLVNSRRVFRLADAARPDDAVGTDSARLAAVLVAAIDASLGEAR